MDQYLSETDQDPIQDLITHPRRVIEIPTVAELDIMLQQFQQTQKDHNHS